MKTERSITSDQSLVAGILQGKTQVFGELYKKYYPKVFYRCLLAIRDHEEAKDIAQDILLKAFHHLSGYRGEASFSTWLYAITSNHCIEYYRRKNLRQFVDLENAILLTELTETPDHKAEAVDLREWLSRSLQHLPVTDRELLVMRYERNLSIGELQQKLHLSQSAVKMRLVRAIKKLKKETVGFV